MHRRDLAHVLGDMNPHILRKLEGTFWLEMAHFMSFNPHFVP